MVALMIMFLVSCDYKRSVPLPCGAVGWSAAFPAYTHLPFED